MLITLGDLATRFCLAIDGVLHVGAHLAEEAADYQALGVPGNRVWWVEANPGVRAKLEREVQRYGQHVLFELVWSEDFVELPFHVTNYDGMSSSVLEFGTHPQFSPDTVFVDAYTAMMSRSIDSLVAEHGIAANFLNLDIQGAELHALQGATEFLKGCIAVYTEVNTAEVYVGCAKLHELDELLDGAGFDRVDTHMVPGQGWGDALYVRR